MHHPIPTIDEAASGLAHWGAKVFKEVPNFSVKEWRPTVAQIDAAAEAGMTWPFEMWERATGDHGLIGIHTALNSCGWSIAPSPVQFSALGF